MYIGEASTHADNGGARLIVCAMEAKQVAIDVKVGERNLRMLTYELHAAEELRDALPAHSESSSHRDNSGSCMIVHANDGKTAIVVQVGLSNLRTLTYNADAAWRLRDALAEAIERARKGPAPR